MERIDHAQVAIDMIDRALEAPPVGIDEALDRAIAKGRMTIKEAEECREAYYAANPAIIEM